MAPQLASSFAVKAFPFLIASLVFWYTSRFAYGLFNALRSPLRRIPGPWYSPLTALHLRYGFATGNIWKLVEKSHKAYGPVVRLGPRQVWISDKDAMKQILLKVDLPKVAMYSEISRDRRSPGLFGEIRPLPHKRLKRFLSPAFTVSYVDQLDVFFAKIIKSLLDKYQNSLGISGSFEVDLMDDLHNVALDMQTVYIKRFLRDIGWDIKFDWPREMIVAIDAVVQRRSRSGDSARPDLLQHLVDEGQKPDTLTRMGTRDIVDQMSEILLVGSETTSGTTACLFLELARNPKVRAKLLGTLPILNVDDEILSSKTVRTEPRFGYLEACIKETLRLHPIASEMGRRTGDQWIKLAEYDLPPHTVVSASYRDLHRNEQHFPRALRFWPERFLPDGERGDAPPADLEAYYPFSAGKHSCIGINFAWAEMRMIAANLLSRFDVVEVSGQDVDFRQYITMQFSTGHWKAVLIPRRVLHISTEA